MEKISLPESNLAKQAESLAAKLRDLIWSQPPKELLGYIYAGVLLNFARSPGVEEKPTRIAGIGWEEAQFLLEYVHAVLACTPPNDASKFDEANEQVSSSACRKTCFASGVNLRGLSSTRRPRAYDEHSIVLLRARKPFQR